MEKTQLSVQEVLGRALISAAREGAVETAKQLIDTGVDVDFQDETTSPLSIASGEGHEALVWLLINRGVQINLKTRRGGAAIHSAASGGRVSAMKILLENGANANMKNDTGIAALEIAQQMGYLEIVQLLLENEEATPSTGRLIIGVDFNRRFSSVAYYFTKQVTFKPQIIRSWSGQSGLSVPYTPSAIEYDANDRNSFTWGYEVHPQSRRKLGGFDLLLDSRHPVPPDVLVSNTRRELLRLNKSAVEVASDYVGALYKHAVDEIMRSYPKQFLDLQRKQLVIVIPAGCSDFTKDSLLKIARQTGVSPITLVTEPVAASLFALHHCKEIKLSIGDAFVLCQVGQDSIELASFEYKGVGSWPKLLVPWTGSLHGSLMLDRIFEKFVAEIVGEEQFIDLKKTFGYEDAIKSFDREVKPSFSEDPNQSWNINFTLANLEDDPSKNLVSNCLRLKHNDVAQIFQPLITLIVWLVAEQVSNVRVHRSGENHPVGTDIKAVFLIERHQVNGLARAAKPALQRAHPEIRIIESPRIIPAHASGALLSQISPEMPTPSESQPSRISDRIAAQ